MMASNRLILCCPFLLLPSIFPSIRIFSNGSVHHIKWPNYWSFSISPSSEYSGLISFRIDGLDLLAVQGTLKSLLQHHSSKASVLWHSALFIVQLSHPYMTIGKTIALTRWTFVGKVMYLLFNMLSKWLITFLPRSSVQFSHSVMSDSLQLHELQHTRPPCPSPTPGVHSDESVMPSSHLMLCRPLLLLPSIPPVIQVNAPTTNVEEADIKWFYEDLQDLLELT